MSVERDMAAYYAQRAAYYERVYFKPERQTDLRTMEAWLPTQFAGRRVLEVACGTGWWTPHGARDALSWLATDLNPETMGVARSKVLPACVQFATVDAYGFQQIEGQSFDGAFAGCWWSHVPLARLPGWLALLHARLLPGSRVVVLDNSFVQTSNLPITRQDDEGNTYQMRTLDDGSAHEVLKNFPSREQALAMLGPRAHSPQWTAYGHYWVLSYLLN
ncbi:MAG: class I SAM-dependent methyltransferase [Rubrivivax sp.]|nr:class I SAM-dependent methyltransferase [Rubrivivax sp.]MDP3612835.1 class I SAM-dependent methyltransferase [Rubrivivax sp.]